MNQPDPAAPSLLAEVLAAVVARKAEKDNQAPAGTIGILTADGFLTASLDLIAALLLVHPEWLAAHARAICVDAFPSGLDHEALTQLLDWIVETVPVPGRSQ